MIFSHAFAGALVSAPIVKRSKLSKKQKDILWIVGIIAGVLPDFDLAIVTFLPYLEHRKLISHSIVPYFIIFLLLFGISLIKKSKFLKQISLVFLAGILSHMFLDYFAGGLVLLAPFTDKYFGNELLCNDSYKAWILYYLSTVYATIEVFIGLAWVALVLKIKNKFAIILPLFFFIAAALSAAFFAVYLG